MMPLYTFLIKSEKNHKLCMGCIDENKRWVRPIKPDNGFLDSEIMMDNGKPIEPFDVVEMEFGKPIPIKHHVENLTFLKNKTIKYIKTLSDKEKIKLLTEISDPQLSSSVADKYELFDKILVSGRSVASIGPFEDFNIGYDPHPKIYFAGKKGKQYNIPCTDVKFCSYIQGKAPEFRRNGFNVNSSQIDELKGKQAYFVIGLTGDHLDEKGDIVSGKYAPPDGSKEARYWPMVVSVLIIPDYA